MDRVMIFHCQSVEPTGLQTVGKQICLLALVAGIGLVCSACTPSRSTSPISTDRSGSSAIKEASVPPAFDYPYLLSLNDVQQLVTCHPNSAVAHYELARVYHVQKEYAKAIPHFEKCLALDPFLLDAYIGLSDCYRYKTPPDWQKAERVLQLLQTHAYSLRYRYIAQMNLGNLYLDHHEAHKEPNDLEKAERAYHEALRTAPKGRGSQAAYGIGIVYARKREWERAKPWFEKAVEWAEKPLDKAQALEALANLYAELGDQQKADILIEEAKRTYPAYPAHLWAL